MSALNPVLLNAEFWFLWLARQLLRGVVIGIGMTSAMVVLVLFWSLSTLGSALETLQERTRATALSRNTTRLAMPIHGHKEILS